MDVMRRPLIIDLFDWNGNKICNIYDSSSQTDGEATDVFVNTERSGWKELNFMLPSLLSDGTKNYRIDYIIPDTRVRIISNDIIDWFLITSPKVIHKASKKTFEVTAGHISQLLKNKNLGLEFSDDKGNNIGTASQLLDTILVGTGWSSGNVSAFYEKDGTTEKVRSLNAPTKTGAFKLISQMCELFEAKPIYNGDSKTIDIVPLNPFSKEITGGTPDLSNADGVIELSYDKNVSSITRVLNSEKIITKLYAYGSYGDKVKGYCGIDEIEHREIHYILSDDISAGTIYKFSYLDDAGDSINRYFTPIDNVTSGSELIYSLMDRSSMSYIYNQDDECAYFVYDKPNGNFEQLEYTSSEEKVVNGFSFIMDFSYYQKNGIFSQEMLDALANYQRNASALSAQVSESYSVLNDSLNELSKHIGGNIKFARLNPEHLDKTGAYLKIDLVDSIYKDGVLYRSDYNEQVKNQFKLHPVEELKENGDPKVGIGSIVYIIHNTDPVTWEKVYLKEIDNKDDPKKLTLWITSSDASQYNITTDQYFIFETNSINGYLGSFESTDESIVSSITNSTTRVTIEHPVIFTRDTPTSSMLPEACNYSWVWKYDEDSPSILYFNHTTKGDTTYYEVKTGFDPDDIGSSRYYFDISKSLLYRKDSQGIYKYNDTTEDKEISACFGVIYKQGIYRDKIYKGWNEKLVYTASETIEAGNYFIEDEYGAYKVVTTPLDLEAGDTITYNSLESWFETNISEVIDTLTAKNYSYDNCEILSTYDDGHAKEIKIDDFTYTNLRPLTTDGAYKGIIDSISKFKTYANLSYLDNYLEYKTLSELLDSMTNDLSETLGELLREGYWQKNDYVDGDEQKLYDDALENLDELSKPETTYSISFLDLYGSHAVGTAISEDLDNIEWPDISIMSAAHLIDTDIGINQWAYIDKINKCYDKPWKTSITINTNLSTIAQHSFTDVMTNIANVANQTKANDVIYKRAKVLTEKGDLATESLNGEIDANRLKIVGGNSTWYTDENGNLMFESADSTSAMMISGNGFAIADSKDKYGDWIWRTFGTGKGFTADEITAGVLRAGMIKILGSDQFYWDGDNISIFDTENRNNVIQIGKYDGEHYGIGFSKDGGETWTNSIGFNGLSFSQGNVQYVIGQLEQDEFIQDIKNNADEAKEIAERTAESSIIDSYMQYIQTTSSTTQPDPDDPNWARIAPSYREGYYTWQRSVNMYADGSTDPSDASCISSASGASGEDATLLRIESSRGTVFKYNDAATVLSAVIYRGSLRITDITSLRNTFGNSAHLEWKWKRRNDDEYQTISSSDPRLSEGGFHLTVSAQDVDVNVVFMCNLIV